MPKIRPLKPDELIRALEKIGFQRIRQSGSHAVYRHPDGRWATVPIHKSKEIAKGLVHKILKDAQLTWDEFEPYL